MKWQQCNLTGYLSASKCLFSPMTGSDCWYECGKRDGPCPHFCGKDGMCCQKGWPWGGCDGKIGPDNMHSCVEKIRGTLLHIALFAMRANSPEGYFRLIMGYIGKHNFLVAK